MDRKPVSPEHAERILRAVDGMVAAKIERDAAMVAALRAGASLREVAKAAGMSMSQTQTISKAGGWPDAKEIKRREAEQAEKDRWNTMIEDYRAGK